MCLLRSVSGLVEEVDRKRVVVIGGSFGASLLAHCIQSFADVVFIDQKEYFEIPWSSLRSVVEPSFAERTVINHTDYLPNAKIIISTATNITKTEVVTAEGQTFPYDYLIVATGYLHSVPRTKAERLTHYNAEFVKLKSASSVLIVGGGASGVELAAEIAVDFPEKRVTLVHRGSRWLEFIGSKASQKALDWLTARGVEVLLNKSINQHSLSSGIIQTSTGQIIEADGHFVCTGQPVGSFWLSRTILKDGLDIQGRVMVDENLRVRGHKNVFVMEDITNIPEIKQGFSEQGHVQVITKNLNLLLLGGNQNKMISYKPSSPIAYVSLGRREALAQFPMVTLGGFVPGMIKSEDLFVGWTRKQLGLKANPE